MATIPATNELVALINLFSWSITVTDLEIVRTYISTTTPDLTSEFQGFYNMVFKLPAV